MAKYQYETSPRKLAPDEIIIPVKKTPEKKKVKTKKKITTKKNKKNAKKKAKQMAKLKLIAALIAVFAVAFTISYRYALMNENFNKAQRLKRELSLLEQENQQLKAKIESDLNLKNIEQIARDELGMVKLSPAQKVYISLPKEDYIETAAEKMEIEDNRNWLQMLLGV